MKRAEVRELRVGDEFVQHELDAHQASDIQRVAPGDADVKGDELKNKVEEQLERQGLAEVLHADGAQSRCPSDPAENGVQQRNDGDEGEEHGDDIDRKLHTVRCAGRRRSGLKASDATGPGSARALPFP